MSDAGVIQSGFFGAMPAAGGLVAWNLPSAFTERWHRWISTDLLDRPSRGPVDARAWRFIVAPGVFCDAPAAGIWRMSEDSAGHRYPLVVARLGPPPDPFDAWFDGIDALLTDAVEGGRPTAWLAERVERFCATAAEPDPDLILFWLDDDEVQEFTFADINDLAANGLRALRAIVPIVEEP
jgi:type VI secretion system protein ImpM